MLRPLIALGLSLLAGCAVAPNSKPPFVERPPYLISQEDVKKIKEAPLFVAVYSFKDLTGARKTNDKFATFSSAVTQGGEAWVIESLLAAGKGKWFKVVERANLANLLNERNIIKQARRDFSEDEVKLGALLFAGTIVEGGIVSYESNTVSGGVGAEYLGIGATKQYRKDNVTVSLRLVSTASGEVLLSSTVSKTILSTSVSGSMFKYFDTDTVAGETEIGYARNERVSVATRKAIDACIIDIVLQGAEKKLWTLID